MPDPLQKDDFRFPSVEDELEENRGKTMAYQAPREDPIRRRAIISKTVTDVDLMSPERQLPESRNSRLNRAAEQIGGAVGSAVSLAQRVPGSARQRLHLVRDRAQHAKKTAADRISSCAASLADATEERARNLMDRVEERGRAALDEVDHLSRRAAERATQLKSQVEDRSREWEMKARVRADQMRIRSKMIIGEHPLEVLGCIAGAAFLTGVSLRIVRARHARRY